MSDILPFKDSFMGLFFVSIGMLVDTGFVIDNALRIAGIVAFIFILKIITGAGSSLLIGNSLRSSIIAGLGLAQIGEFSFVLAVAGKTSGLISEEFYQIFLSSSIVTMIMTPFIMNMAPSATEWITTRPLLKKVFHGRRLSEVDGTPRKRHDHVVIIGFGLNRKKPGK